MSSPFATPKKPATDALLHPPGSAVGIAIAAANEAQGKDGLDSVHAVMGNLTGIDFEDSADDLLSQVDGLQEAANENRVTGDQLKSLLKLFATEAQTRVADASESAENKVYRVMAAKDGAVNMLKKSTQQLQQDNDDLALLLKQAKHAPGNISQSEKQFEFLRGRFNNFYGTLTSRGYIKLMPGQLTHVGSDEAGMADILLQPVQSKDDQTTMVQIDARIKIKSSQLRTLRLTVAQMINPAVTQKQMENAKATPFPIAQYAGVANQTDWRTIVLGWIKNPGNLNKYLEIAGDIVMMHSAWDPAVGYYRNTAIDMVAPIHWTPLQQEGDPMGFTRALQSQMLFDEIVTLSVTHAAAGLAFRTGVNVGFSGLTSIVWADGSGLRSIHLALLHLKTVRTSDVLAMQDQLRRLHNKFTGDAKLATAMAESEVVIRKAAEMNAVPAWIDVGKPIFTAISSKTSYFYAKAVEPFEDGGAARGWDIHDCTSTLDLMFDQLKNKIKEAVVLEDKSEKGLKKKGLQLEAMKAVVKATKDCKSAVYKGLNANQQKAIKIHLSKQNPDLVWGSLKGNKMVHAMAMKLTTGETLSLPTGDKKKQGEKRQRGEGGSKQGSRKKGCQVKDCKWGVPHNKERNKPEMFCKKHFDELKGGTTLELEGGKMWVPREQYTPDTDKVKAPPKKQTKKAFTITVKDKGSDTTREMTVDREWIDTIVGLQSGALEKVEASGTGMSDDEMQKALDTLTTFGQ